MDERSDRVVLSTERRDEAVAMLARSFPGTTLTFEPSSTPFRYRQSLVTAGPLRIVELGISGTAVAHGPGRPGAVSSGFVLAGRMDARSGRHRIDTSRPFLRPADDAVLQFRDARVRFLLFETEAFRAVAERSGDGLRRRLLRTAPVTQEAGEAWRWAADRITEVLGDARRAANAVLQPELFEMGVRMLLACFGEAAPASSSEPDVRLMPIAVRRAVAYLEEHAGGSVAVPQVASAARVSARSLQSLFRRHLGTTPLGHLHAIRLDAARSDLLAAAGTEVSVHEVAHRWGFGNSGRFARLYAERFGERPSDTLRLG